MLNADKAYNHVSGRLFVYFSLRVIAMKLVQVYCVSVKGEGFKASGKVRKAGWHYVNVTSLRAAIALTWGLVCSWSVERLIGTEWATVAFNDLSSGAWVHCSKWAHNVRAFKSHLVNVAACVPIATVEAERLIRHDSGIVACVFRRVYGEDSARQFLANLKAYLPGEVW